MHRAPEVFKARGSAFKLRATPLTFPLPQRSNLETYVEILLVYICFAQKRMKPGLRFVEETQGSPQAPWDFVQLLSDTPKNIYGKTCVYLLIGQKHLFGRIIFWPNINALVKNAAKIKTFV
jgi:hypothetical protein